jgi:hypothetical protein
MMPMREEGKAGRRRQVVGGMGGISSCRQQAKWTKMHGEWAGGGMEEELRLQQMEGGRLVEDRMWRRCGGEGGRGEVREREKEKGGIEEALRLQQMEEGRLVEDRM